MALGTRSKRNVPRIENAVPADSVPLVSMPVSNVPSISVPPTLVTRDAPSTPSSEASTSKSTRDETHDKGLEKLNKAVQGKLEVVIPTGVGRPKQKVQCNKLSSELGIVSRNFIPVPTNWKVLKEEQKQPGWERLDRDMETNEELNRIEFYKLTNYKEGKGWASLKVEANYNKVKELLEQSLAEGDGGQTIDEIVDSVLGKKRGYIKGLGYGPKPISSSSSNARVMELKEELSRTCEEAASLKDRMETTTVKMAAILARHEQYDKIFATLMEKKYHCFYDHRCPSIRQVESKNHQKGEVGA